MPPPSWAFQVENFNPPPDEELVCSICRCVFCEPVECPCHHVFCEECIKKWLSTHRTCPICRERVIEASIQPVVPLIKNMIMKMTIRCKNAEAGCNTYVTVENCETHIQYCLFESNCCPNKCGKILYRKDVLKHEFEECPFRYVECDECGLRFSGTREEHNCIQALKEAVAEHIKKEEELEKEVKELQAKLAEQSKRQRLTPPDLSFGFDNLSSVSFAASSDGNEGSIRSQVPSPVSELISSSSSTGSDDYFSDLFGEFSGSTSSSSLSSSSSSQSDSSEWLPRSNVRITLLDSSNSHSRNSETSSPVNNAVRPLKRPVTSTDRCAPERKVRSNNNIQFQNGTDGAADVGEERVRSNSCDRTTLDKDGNMSADDGRISYRASKGRKAQRLCPIESTAEIKSAAAYSAAANENGEQDSYPSTSRATVTKTTSRKPKGKSRALQMSGKNASAATSQVVRMKRRKKNDTQKEDGHPENDTSATDGVSDARKHALVRGNLSESDSDPDYVPNMDEESGTSTESTSSSVSLVDIASDSSYEVKVPSTTYELLERYSRCDSEEDSDYVP